MRCNILNMLNNLLKMIVKDLKKIFKDLLKNKYFFFRSTNHKDIGFFYLYLGLHNRLELINIYNRKIIIYIYMYFILNFNKLLIKYNNKIYLLDLLKFRIKVQNFNNLINLSILNNDYYYKIYINQINKYYRLLILFKEKYFYYLNFYLLKSDEELLYMIYFLYKEYLNFKNIKFNLIFIKYIDLLFYFIKKKKLINLNLTFNKLNSSKEINYKIYKNYKIINDYNKSLITYYIKNIKANKVLLFLYNDLFFDKNLYKLIYNNEYFFFFKNVLLKKYYNYFFFKNEIINLLDFRKNLKSNKRFNELEVIYKLKNFKFIQNFEISLYDKKFFKNMHNYSGQFLNSKEILDLSQYLCMLQENIYMYINILYNDVIKKKISERKNQIKGNLNNIVNESDRIKENFEVVQDCVEFFINMDRFFHFFLETGYFYINYYLIYFLYNMTKYLNVIFLNCKNNNMLDYIYNKLKINFFNLFDMYIYLMYEYENRKNNKILNYEYNYTKFINVYNNKHQKINYNKKLYKHIFKGLFITQNEFINDSKYTYYTDIAYFLKNKNSIEINNPKLIDQIYYNYVFFENKNLFKINLSLIDERFKIYLDLNILNKRAYEKKYTNIFKKKETYEIINAYYDVYDLETLAHNTEYDMFLEEPLVRFSNKYYLINQKPEELSSMIFYDNLEYFGLNRLFLINNSNNIEYLRFNFFFKYFIYINKLFLLEYILLYEYNLQLPEIYKIGPIKYEQIVDEVKLKDQIYNFFIRWYNFFVNSENFEKYNFKFFNYTIYYGFYIQFIFFFFFFFLKKFFFFFFFIL